MTRTVGIVVIGKNEGERLRACLRSLKVYREPIAYVDSGSTDGSVALANRYGAEVVELDMLIPFTAARARNAGYRQLLESHPGIQFFQFIDGDCTLEPGWISAAVDTFKKNDKLAALVGHLYEKNPDLTPYNKLCELEWRSPVGEVANGAFGGIVMLRTSALQEVGGYNSELVAGEEPELGARMKLAGYHTQKIDQKMATHDANMTHFAQWWKRAVRFGHAQGLRSHTSTIPNTADNNRAIKSTLFWGLLLPLIIIITAIPSKGFSLALLGGYLVLGYRIFSYRKNTGDTAAESLFYARYTVLEKFANALGLLKFNLNYQFGKFKDGKLSKKTD